MQILNFWWVFLGGGLGSICRYGIAQLLQPYQSTFPWATWTANVISCIILGSLLALNTKAQMDLSARLLLLTGFCGGFSTFSTFTAESLTLIQNQQVGTALIYITSSLMVCLLAMLFGMKLVELF